jgi:hypothetical protein
MGFGFELVGERLQLWRLAGAIRERLREEPVGEPGIPRQEWAMKVRPNCTADATALPAALAVIPETRHDPAKRLRTGIEAGPARVILEARERPEHAGLELALQQNVTDHPSLVCDRVEWEDADSRQVRAVKIAVRPPEELVPAAHRE